MSADMKEIPDVLIAKVYPVDDTEFNAVHGYVPWPGDFAGRLVALIGNPSR
jgi:hypothetical protein